MRQRELVFVIPGDINTPTGGYIYDRKLLEKLKEQGVKVTVLSLSDSFPNPSEEDQLQAQEKLSQVSEHTPLIIDGLALGALDPTTVSSIKSPVIALVHHPLAFETGLSSQESQRLFDTEFENLKRVKKILVPSQFTKNILVEKYKVDRKLITVATPGIELNPLKPSPAEPPMILSVGIIAYRKGHDVLLRALAKIVDLPWQAVIAGSVRDQEYADQLFTLQSELGLQSRVRFIGHVDSDELATYYSKAHVFALATRHEGYGMVFAEAMANGLPIITCDAGASAETVGDKAGIFADIDSPDSFAEALSKLLMDDRQRQRMSLASLARASELGDWNQTASHFIKALDEIENS